MLDFKQRFEIIYKKFAVGEIEKGIKPSELAFSRFAEVSQTTMQRWKKGQVPASKDIKTIHDKLGFAYDWLISGKGEMYDASAQRISKLEEQIDSMQQEIDELKKEISALRTKNAFEGVTDEKSATDTGRAAGQK